MSNHLLMYPGSQENQIVAIGLSYMYASGPYQWATTPRACTTLSYLPFWKYSLWLSQHASPLGLMIQDIKGKFLWCVKFQHVTSSIWISPSCSNVSVLISWINFKTNELAVDLKCVGCISAGKQWDNLWLGVGNQQHDWAIVISVGIFDNVYEWPYGGEVIIFEGGGAPTITFNCNWKISKMYRIICAYDKGLQNRVLVSSSTVEFNIINYCLSCSHWFF